MSSGVSVSSGLLIRASKERSGYLFILPHFIFFAVFFLIPVIWGIYYSFFNYTLFDFEFWGLRGYAKLLKDRKNRPKAVDPPAPKPKAVPPPPKPVPIPPPGSNGNGTVPKGRFGLPR